MGDVRTSKLRTEITVEGAQGFAVLEKFSKQLEGMSGAVKKSLGLLSKETGESIHKFDELGHVVSEITGPAKSLFSSITSQIPGLNSGLSSIAGPGGIAIAVVTAIGGGALAAGVGLFKLASASAEMGNKIFEAQEKTSLSAKSLSAFAFAGKEVGLTVEEVRDGLSKFVVNMGLAADGTAKGGKVIVDAFKKMGVDVKKGIQDPDEALATFVKHFAELPTQQDRIVVASEVFGKRFGSNLVAMFNEVGGDLGKFEQMLAAKGLLVTDEEARQSHEFEKLKKDIESQTEGIERQVGAIFIPKLLGALGRFSDWLTTNRGEILQHANAFGDWAASMGRDLEKIGHDFSEMYHLAHGVLSALLGETFALREAGKKEVVDAWNSPTQAERKARAETQGTPEWFAEGKALSDRLIAEAERHIGEEERNKRAVTGTRGGGGGKKHKEAKDELLKFKEIVDQVNRSMALYGDKTKYAEVQQEFLKEFLKVKLTPALQEQALALEAVALHQAAQFDARKRQDEEDKGRASALDAANKKEQEQARTLSEYLQQQANEIDHLSGVEHTAVENTKKWIEEFQALGGVIDKDTLALLRMNAAIEEHIKIHQRLGQQNDLLDAMTRISDSTKDKDGIEPKAADLGNAAKTAPIDKLKAAYTELKSIGTSALSSLTRGMGSLVEAWVMTGSAAQGGMKKVTASVLAGVAAQSAPLALFYLAKAIGDLFWEPEASAAEFQAAAMFGALATGSALLGRKLAGNQAAPNAAGGTGSSTSAIGTTAAYGGARAMGGPVSAGSAYIVGEHRPEVFIPSRPGWIHPNTNVTGGGGGGDSALLAAVHDMLASLHSRLDSMSPGEVLTLGAKQEPHAVSEGLLRSMKRDGGKRTEIGRQFGLA